MVVTLGWGAAVSAGIAACSSDHHSFLSSTAPSVPAQPSVVSDDGPPPPPVGCPCEPSVEVDLTVTDSAGNPIDCLWFPTGPETYPGQYSLTAVCIGNGDQDAAPDAEPTEGSASFEAGSADGPAVDGTTGDAAAVDALAPRDAGEAGTGPCRTWRIKVTEPTPNTASFEVFAAGYAVGTVTVPRSSTSCCDPVGVVARSIVLQRRPACSPAYEPCAIDASAYRAALACVSP